MKVTQIDDPLEAVKLCQEGKIVFYLTLIERVPGKLPNSPTRKTVAAQFRRLDGVTLRNVDFFNKNPLASFVLLEDVPEEIANTWAESMAIERVTMGIN